MKIFIKSILVLFVFLSALPANSRNRVDDDNDYAKFANNLTVELKKSLQEDSVLNNSVVISPYVKYVEYHKPTKGEMVVQIISFASPFLFFFAVICIIIWYRRNKFIEKCKIINKAIENDYRLPESFFDKNNIALSSVLSRDDAKPSYFNLNALYKRIYSALIWIALGLTGIIFFAIVGSNEIAVLCIFPLLVGLAKLITILLVKFLNRKSN